jgi:hypothetical protein
MEGSAGLPAVFAGGKRLIGVGDIDQVVGQAGAFLRGGLSCSQVHAAIDGD